MSVYITSDKPYDLFSESATELEAMLVAIHYKPTLSIDAAFPCQRLPSLFKKEFAVKQGAIEVSKTELNRIIQEHIDKLLLEALPHYALCLLTSLYFMKNEATFQNHPDCPDCLKTLKLDEAKVQYIQASGYQVSIATRIPSNDKPYIQLREARPDRTENCDAWYAVVRRREA